MVGFRNELRGCVRVLVQKSSRRHRTRRFYATFRADLGLAQLWAAALADPGRLSPEIRRIRRPPLTLFKRQARRTSGTWYTLWRHYWCRCYGLGMGLLWKQGKGCASLRRLQPPTQPLRHRATGEEIDRGETMTEDTAGGRTFIPKCKSRGKTNIHNEGSSHHERRH